jgi:hypothetical protein
MLGRDSSVGIVTPYCLDCPDRPWGPLSLLHKGYRVSSSGVNLPGRGVDHLPPPNAEVKERV